MEHAWDYFKTDESIFKTIIESEEEFVINLMKKKYGKEYDGINVKTKIKKSEVPLFSLAEEIVKIDLLYVDSLIKKGKKYQNYFNKSNNFLKKLEFIYNLSDDELVNIVDTLPNKKRNAILYIFGFNRKKMSFYEASQFFDCSYDDLVLVIKDAIHAIETNECKKVEKRENVPVIKKTKVVATLIPTSLASSLKKKGYTLDDLKKILNRFNEQEITCLRHLYGYDLTSSKPYYVNVSKEEETIIIDVLKRAEKYLEEKIDIKPKEKKYNLKDYYIKRGYSKKSIDEAFNSLSDAELSKLHLLYDDFYNRLNVTLSKEELIEISRITYSEKDGILAYLINEKRNKSNENYIEDILAYYVSLNYEEDIIIDAIKNINPDSLSMLYIKYDPFFKLKKDIRVTDSTKKKIIKIVKEEIKEILDKGEKRIDTLITYYKNEGFTKEDIKRCIDFIDEERRNELKKFINLDTLRIKINFKQHKSMNYYLTLTFKVYMYYLRLIHNEDVSNLNVNNVIKERALVKYNAMKDEQKKTTLYDLFSKNGYTAVDFSRALENLDERSIDLKDYIDINTFEINAKDEEELKELSNRIRRTLPTYMYYFRLIHNEDVSNLIISGTYKESALKRYESYLNNDDKKSKIIIYYEKLGFTHGDIKRTINIISDERKEEVSEYIDLNTLEHKKNLKYGALHQYLFQQFVADMYYLKLTFNEDVSNITINSRLKEKAMSKYKTYIKKKELNEFDFKSFYTNLGFNDSEIKKLISSFSSKSFNLLEYVDESTLKIIKPLNQNIYNYLTKTLIIDAYVERLKKGITVDNIKIDEELKNKAQLKYEKSLKGGKQKSISSFQNLYEYYENLGYTRDDVNRTLKEIPTNIANLEKCINLDTLDIIDIINKYPNVYNYLYFGFIIDMYYLKLTYNEDISEIKITDSARYRALGKYRTYLSKEKEKNIDKEIISNTPDLESNNNEDTNKNIVDNLKENESETYSNDTRKPKSLRVKNTKKYKMMIKDLTNYYVSLGYLEEIVDDVLRTNLTNEEIILLSSSYNDYFVKTDEYNRKVENIIREKIMPILEKIKTQEQEKTKITKKTINKTGLIAYIRSLKELNIINKEFLDAYSLSTKDNFYLTLEFIWNKNNLYTLDEMASYLELSLDTFMYDLYNAINHIVTLSNSFSDKDNIKRLIDVGDDNE